MLAVMILEDSFDTITALEAIIKPCSDSIRVFVATNVKQAEELLEQQIFGLFFLDVNLNITDNMDASGIQFAKNLRRRKQYEFTPIVFISSIIELELMSYRETQCYRYITKPFKEEEVRDIVRKVLSNQKQLDQPQVTVKKDGINYCLALNEIVYIEAMPRGIIIHLVEESIEVKYLSIKQIMEKLTTDSFIQCHRMFVINVNYIDYVDSVNRVVKMKGYQNMVEIGVTYKADMRRLVHE